MSTAAQQTESSALPGDDFVPSADDHQEVLPGDDAGGPASLADAGDQQGGGESEGQDDVGQQYNAETLALIAGEDKPNMVPHSRFKEKNEEAKAAKARVQELEIALARLEGRTEAAAPPKQEQAAAAAFDFDEAEDRYQAAFMDGDNTKAKQIRAEIRAEERRSAIAEAEQVADQRYKQNRAQDEAARTKLEFDIELNKAYAAFPFLDKDSADANPEAIDETLVWVKAFQDKGKTAAEALAAAAAKIGPRYVKTASTDAATVKPDIQKGIDRAAAIPPKATGLGARTHKLDVTKMTSEEFRKMTPEDRARFEESM